LIERAFHVYFALFAAMTLPPAISMATEREVNRAIVNAEFHITFAGVESTERPPTMSGQHHPWAKAKLDELDRKVSLRRRMRMDFELRNVPLVNPEQDRGKFRYHLFSVKWPVLSIFEMNKKQSGGWFTVVTNFEGMNTNALIEEHGNYFLDNAYVSDRYDVTLESEKPLEKYEDRDTVILVLDKTDEIDVGIVSPQEFPRDKTFTIRGHCVFGGALINAVRGARWYPFDAYAATIGLAFPFDETDARVMAGSPEGFVVQTAIKGAEELRNKKLAKGKVADIKIDIRRRAIAKGFVGPFLVMALTLVASMVKPFEPSILLRGLMYLASLVSLYFLTLPAAGIVAWFPLRFISFLLTLNLIALREYLRYMSVK